jgi:hypothetical protein
MFYGAKFILKQNNISKFLAFSYFTYSLMIISFIVGLFIESLTTVELQIPSILYKKSNFEKSDFLFINLFIIFFFSLYCKLFALLPMKNIINIKLKKYINNRDDLILCILIALMLFSYLNKIFYFSKILDFYFNLTFVIPFYVAINSDKLSYSKYFLYLTLVIMLILGMSTGSRGLFLYHIALFVIGLILNARNYVILFFFICIAILILIIGGYIQMLRYEADLNIFDFILNFNLWLVAVQNILSRITSYSTLIAFSTFTDIGIIDMNGILADINFYINGPELEYEQLINYLSRENLAYGIVQNFGLDFDPGIVPPVTLFAETLYRGGFFFMFLMLNIYLISLLIFEFLIMIFPTSKQNKLYIILLMLPLFSVKFHEWSGYYILKSIPIYLVFSFILIVLLDYSISTIKNYYYYEMLQYKNSKD